MGLGEKFRTERENQGITLDMVEEETKIRKLYLNALENDEYSVLPPRVYALGFVKRYAKFLGLNEKEAVETFTQAAYGNDEPEEEIIIPAASGINLPIKNIIAGIIFLAIIIWIGNYLVGYLNKNVEENHQLDNPTQVQEKADPETGENKDENNDVADDATGESVYEPGTATVQLDIIEECWVRAVVDGTVLFEETLSAGEERVLVGNEYVKLKVGNAGGINVTYNGEKIEPLGESGIPMEREFLPTE